MSSHAAPVMFVMDMRLSYNLKVRSEQMVKIQITIELKCNVWVLKM